MKRIGEYILRGYGQFFLCCNVRSGLLFLVGMIIASPANGLLSFLGALSATLTAFKLSERKSLLKTGFYGVNGALIGYSWILFPEPPFLIKVMIVLIAGVLSAILMMPAMRILQKKESPFSPFSLPYVILMWLSLLVLNFTGHYDMNSFKGWHQFYHSEWEKAEKSFRETEYANQRGRAYKYDASGWIEFKRGKYREALEFFNKAVKEYPRFADAYDGLGWTHFKLNQYEAAARHFREAVELDCRLADSWDGLGWTAYIDQRFEEAAGYFKKAMITAPLFDDPYYGMSFAFRKLKMTEKADFYSYMYARLKRILPPKFRFISIFQLLCWGCFILGILLHSRISGLLAVAVLLYSSSLNHYLGTPLNWKFGINFYYNLAALAVALGGHYLVWNMRAALMSAGCITLMHFIWTPLNDLSVNLGIPLLSLPFNLAIIIVITLACRLNFKGLHPVPLEIAVKNPKSVKIWHLKRSIVVDCWNRIRRGHKNFSSSKSVTL